MLTRNDAGTFTLAGDTYTGDTLLSWPGSPTDQTLTGTYGGTWSQLNGNDNVIVTWSGAQSGGYSVNPPPSVQTTTYPTSASGGAMPLASGTSQGKQTWSYAVSDAGDGSMLPLTWKWVAHFAYENFAASSEAGFGGVPLILSTVGSWTIPLNQANPSGSVTVPGNVSVTFHTTFADPNYGTIPGFQATGLQVAYSPLQQRWGQTTTVTNSGSGQSGTFTVTWNETQGDGSYGYELDEGLNEWAATATAWNSKGQSDPNRDGITFQLDNDPENKLLLAKVFTPSGLSD